MLKKTRRVSNSETLKKFEEFMKKRLEKKSILQSQNQTIDRKILCFQQLLKLTKTGETLTNSTQKQPVSVMSKKGSRAPDDKRKEQRSQFQQNTELVAGKLDRMVHDVTGWVFSKKTSMHTSSDERKYKALEKTAHPSTAVEKQPKCTGYQSSKISRVKYGSNLIEYLTDDPGKMEEQCNSSNNPKKYYAPLPQHKNSKNLLKVNKYPSKTIDIAPKTPDFASLKHEITLYENRAREIYGLTFERVPPKESVEDFQQPFQESKEMMRVISSNELRKVNDNPYRQLVDEHTRVDSSVPANLLGIIRSSSAKTRKAMNYNMSGSRYIRV